MYTALNSQTYLNTSQLNNNYQKRCQMYSFYNKIELQKYVMRRYVKTRVFTLFNPKYLNNSSEKKNFSQIFWEQQGQTDDSTLREYINIERKSEIPLANHLKTLISNIPSYTKWERAISNITYTESFSNITSFYAVKRIRFKPGYMNIWRKARKSLVSALGVKLPYQYRLTRYLARYKKSISRYFIFSLEMRLQDILVKTRFFQEKHTALLFIQEKLIFINGLLCTNEQLQLYTNDFVQLIISIKYYVYTRWLFNWAAKRRLKLRLRTKKKLAPVNQIEDKRRTKHYPEWILHNRYSIIDVASFLEVDFLTLSAFLLYEPSNRHDFSPYTVLGIRYGILNVYNWKYIT